MQESRPSIAPTHSPSYGGSTMSNEHESRRRSFLRRAVNSTAAVITAPYWPTATAAGTERFDAANDRSRRSKCSTAQSRHVIWAT